MPKQTVALPLMFSILTAAMPAVAGERPSRLAMMDMMMPMGAVAPAAGAMPVMAPAPAAPAPATAPPMGRMGDDKMPMGSPMPAPGQGQMPMGQPAAPMGQMPTGQIPMGQMPMGQTAPMVQPMTGCPMMAMMQSMMRPGGAPMPGMAPQPGMAPMPGSGASNSATAGIALESTGSSAARLEGRIAFLRTELKIAGAAIPLWETFATSLRAGLEHLSAARAALQDSGTMTDPMARLESFESHLRARTEAIHTTRMAFVALYAQLDDVQKRVATVNMLPFIGAF